MKLRLQFLFSKCHKHLYLWITFAVFFYKDKEILQYFTDVSSINQINQNQNKSQNKKLLWNTWFFAFSAVLCVNFSQENNLR